MGQTDALRMVEHVNQRLVDLAVHNNPFRDCRLADICRSLWSGEPESGGLISDLWVEGAFPACSSTKTLADVSNDNLFPKTLCEHLHQQGVFPKERFLYKHQAETLIKSQVTDNGLSPSLVVTAGTGSGKTEAFLLPMLRRLYTTNRISNSGGMRCLILYPMNALVADQVDRLYDWLIGQDKISVFHFTSETPEDESKANAQGEPRWEACRPRTRKEARINVPDIVITNYSMLEYMLCRPQDRCFFGPDLQCIILDEAHLYSGILAAEITLLLRRVRERCGVAPENLLQIATSATLGGDDEELQKFTAELFSTTIDNTHVIRGEQTKPDIPVPISHSIDNSVFTKLSVNSSTDISTLNAEDDLITDNPKQVDDLLEILLPLIPNVGFAHNPIL